MKTIKPHSELPWNVDIWKSEGTNNEHIQIYDKNEEVVIEDILFASDASYIETACNYFPEMLDLLRQSLEYLNQVPNNKYCENYRLCNKIENFFIKLEK